MGLTHLSAYTIGYNPVNFDDTQGHWGERFIGFLASREIVIGCADGIFEPDGNVTRAEFVKMLSESVDGIDIAGYTNSANTVGSASSTSAGFSDIAGDAWYAGYVNWAARLEIVLGYTDGRFDPNGLITREQMAAITERFVKTKGYNLKVVQKTEEFTDYAEISPFAAGAARSMQQYGVMGGNPDGSFKPAGTATRAEAARVIRTYIEAALGMLR
jgi:hypothetical protein